MYYEQLANILAERKLRLGMSEALIAKRASLSQPTVHRILSGTHHKAAWNDVMAIAEVLGLVKESVHITFCPVEDMLDEQATVLASMMVGISQATNQLEGQGMSADQKKRMINESKIKLLSGARGRLWMET